MSHHIDGGKQFQWQYSGEKILFWLHESIISFLFHIFFLGFSFTLFLCVISSLISYFLSLIFWILFFFVWIFLMGYYFFHEFHSSYLIFTTRRIIKNIHSGFFAQHRKELHVKDFKQITSVQNTFIEKVFWYGNIIVNFWDASWIQFRWIKNAREVSEYVARVMDYMDKNGATDDISQFKTRKERYNK